MSLFSEFARMQRDMDRMWRRFDQEFGVLSNNTNTDTLLWAPHTNWMDVDKPLLTNTNEQQQQITDAAGKKETQEEKRIDVGKEQPQQSKQQLQTVNHPSQQLVAQRSNWLSPFGGVGLGGALILGPRVDIQEQVDKYVVSADLPGVPKENIKVDLDTDNNLLTLSGHTEHAKEEKDPSGAGKWVRRERSSGSFTRSLRLPSDIKTDQLTAKLDNGVLRVELPRVPPAADPKLKDNKQAIKID